MKRKQMNRLRLREKKGRKREREHTRERERERERAYEREIKKAGDHKEEETNGTKGDEETRMMNEINRISLP